MLPTQQATLVPNLKSNIFSGCITLPIFQPSDRKKGKYVCLRFSPYTFQWTITIVTIFLDAKEYKDYFRSMVFFFTNTKISDGENTENNA
jgi:hypothetical protein